ncbi:MAG TPA: D-hexose-6-phosphate mutarotase [Dermatophilaceae bacterium]|nr:D-hexose-6-phosphate mutarotase [Dermatophilaceae bacterium]
MSVNALPDGAEVTTGLGDTPVVSVNTPACTGQVQLRGAHVLAWQPAGADPVLWTSREATHAAGEPLRGGIPLCAPWFVFGRSGNREPLHGFVQFVPWRLESVASIPSDDASPDIVQVTMSMAGTDAHQHVEQLGIGGTADYPPAYECRCTIGLGAELTVTWSVRSLGPALDWEQAMHTHLVVGDVRRAWIDGMNGATYLDKVAPDGTVQHQWGPLRFHDETDRVYHTEATLSLEDPVLRRRVRIARTGSAQSVVWNPWAGKARDMADFGDEEWPGMVCVETANVLTETVRLSPGGQHTMSTRLSVESW